MFRDFNVMYLSYKLSDNFSLSGFRGLKRKDRQIYRQIDGWTYRQIDRQIHRNIEIEREMREREKREKRERRRRHRLFQFQEQFTHSIIYPSGLQGVILHFTLYRVFHDTLQGVSGPLTGCFRTHLSVFLDTIQDVSGHFIE